MSKSEYSEIAARIERIARGQVEDLPDLAETGLWLSVASLREDAQFLRHYTQEVLHAAPLDLLLSVVEQRLDADAAYGDEHAARAAPHAHTARAIYVGE